MRTHLTQRILRALPITAIVAAGLSLSLVAHAEVNKALKVKDWVLVRHATVDFVHDGQASPIECVGYNVQTRVQLENLTSSAVGQGLQISIIADGRYTCASLTLTSDIPAGATKSFNLTCRTLSDRVDGNDVPTSLQAIVHQAGNVSNGANGAVRSTPSWAWEVHQQNNVCGAF